MEQARTKVSPPIRVLVACEFSGIVRDAFSRRGHDAWSCDLLPSERSGNHIQGDIIEHLGGGWDLMIAHPPCTYLASSGLHWNKRVLGRQSKTEEALQFIRQLIDAPIKKIALENPIGCISTRIRKPSQTIQPWMFGEDASKATCLWLKHLPPLRETNPIRRPRWMKCPCCDDYWCQIHNQHAYDCECLPVDDLAAQGVDPFNFYYSKYYANQTPTGQNKLGPSPTRARERSRTYQGIADAMADQWG